MKRIVNLILVSLILIVFTVPVSANTSDGSLQTVFVADIPLSSAENKENLSVLSEDLNQIVLCSKKGGEVWTIGLLKNGDTILTYDEIEARLNEELQLLDTSVSLSPDDFYIEYYETNSSESEIMSLNSVESSFALNQQVDCIDTLNIFSNVVESSSILSPWAIDGSHYEYVEMGDHLKKVWYNQITDSQSNICVTPSSPYGGDGNNRTDSGYLWFPSYVRAEFITDPPQWERTCVSLTFSFSPANLQNLNHDDNEALEMEIVFYNYTNPNKEEDKGYSFVPVNGNPSTCTYGNDYRNPRSWVANFENAYLDTAFADNSNEISSCVGIYDTSTLVANRSYQWDINYYGYATRQNKPNDGRFNVIAQRSYCIDTDIGSIDQNPDLIPFRVFSEEKEGMIQYGLHENSNLNWISSAYNAFDTTSWVCDLSQGGIWRNKQNVGE